MNIDGDTLNARFSIGQVVKHRLFPFRGVIYDVDPEFANTEEWYQAIPAHIRPRKDQPFYHLLAENDEGYYEAYVSEQNLLIDDTGLPVEHPSIPDMFGELEDGFYRHAPGLGH
ncbi:MAG: heat shock protein HspQ [Gammaproteobacteria bacterium]|nr:heat shock protein HspQ [Gammaproteobacteria bacterium]